MQIHGSLVQLDHLFPPRNQPKSSPLAAAQKICDSFPLQTSLLICVLHLWVACFVRGSDANLFEANLQPSRSEAVWLSYYGW